MLIASLSAYLLPGPPWEEMNQFPPKQNAGTQKHSQHIYATIQNMQHLLFHAMETPICGLQHSPHTFKYDEPSHPHR